MDWVVYILGCADTTLYTGITNDLPARLAAHESGSGAKYTRGRGPFELLYREEFPSRSEASRRERAIKSKSRRQKLALCGGMAPSNIPGECPCTK
ncbi:MAG: GIY-YIG nuclease family protein [Alphaproteobacteria bacterium]|nr:GIY-YIG nuclease family protein [Alphaproteobacteria bacterium]